MSYYGQPYYGYTTNAGYVSPTYAYPSTYATSYPTSYPAYNPVYTLPASQVVQTGTAPLVSSVIATPSYGQTYTYEQLPENVKSRIEEDKKKKKEEEDKKKQDEIKKKIENPLPVDLKDVPLPWNKENEDEMKPFFVCFYPVPVEKKKEEKKKEEEKKPQSFVGPTFTYPVQPALYSSNIYANSYYPQVSSPVHYPLAQSVAYPNRYY